MFGIYPEIAALPVTVAGQNMVRLVNCRTCSYRVIAKLEGECCKQENRSCYEETLFVQVAGSKILDCHVAILVLDLASFWPRGTQGAAAERVAVEVELDRIELLQFEKLIQLVLQAEIKGPRCKRA